MAEYTKSQLEKVKNDGIISIIISTANGKTHNLTLDNLEKIVVVKMFLGDCADNYLKAQTKKDDQKEISLDQFANTMGIPITHF